MEDQSKIEIWGAITALNHLLEATWETLILESDTPLEDCRAAAARNLAEFDLPGRNPPSERLHVVSQHALSRLEKFWADMEARIRFQTE